MLRGEAACSSFFGKILTPYFTHEKKNCPRITPGAATVNHVGHGLILS